MDDRIYQDLVNSYYNLYETKDDEGLSPGEKMKARLKRSGDPDEVSRQARHLFGRYQKKKKPMVNNEEIIIDYLLDEGFTDSEKGAQIILQNMSEEWYEFIIEGLPKTSTTNLQGHKEEIAKLTGQINALRQKQKSPKGLTPQEMIRLAKLGIEIKNWQKSSSQLLKTTDTQRNVTKSGSRQSNPDDRMTPEERKAFRDTRTRVPTGTPEEREKRKKAIEQRKPATAGQTPQSTKMNLAPVTTITGAQRAAAAASDAIVGGKDPSYYDKQGNKVALTSQGESERTYRKGTSARYQQGATGSGTRGATPAGSTVDPERQKGPRGTGRRPQS